MPVTEQHLSITLPDGSADAYLYSTPGERNPGILFLTDIGGIRDAELKKARHLAEQGYAVLVPNIFYRTGKPPVIPYPADLGSEPMLKRMQELRGPLTPEAIARDANAYINFLTSQPSVAPGPIGVVGYCFSGAMAMRIAAERPDKVAALALFHAGRLYLENDPNSPHLLLPKIKARAYFGHAIQDKGMPAEAIAKFEDALRKWGGRFESETYDGAYHSWTTLDSPVYNEAQAERAFGKLTEILAGTLKESKAA
jgi:carboxymethylenebutenolidase